MSALRKCRMVEGQPGETAYLTANMSVLLRQADRFCCVTAAAFYRRRVLAIATVSLNDKTDSHRNNLCPRRFAGKTT